jgi:hypothetical protein
MMGYTQAQEDAHLAEVRRTVAVHSSGHMGTLWPNGLGYDAPGVFRHAGKVIPAIWEVMYAEWLGEEKCWEARLIPEGEKCAVVAGVGAHPTSAMEDALPTDFGRQVYGLQ